MNDFLIKLIGYLVIGTLRAVGDILPIEGRAHIQFAYEVAKLFDISELLSDFSYASDVVRVGSFLGVVWFFRREITAFVHAAMHRLRNDIGFSPRNLPSVFGGKLRVRVGAGVISSLCVTVACALLVTEALVRFDILQEPGWLCVGLFVNGLIISVTALYARGTRRIDTLHFADFVFIGVAQSLGVLPGLSRLALLMCSCLWRKLSWQESVRLSLFLSLPTLAIASARAAQLYLLNRVPLEQWLWLVVGSVAALVVASLAIRLLFRTSMHSKGRFLFFGLYCMAAGVFAYFMLYFHPWIGDGNI